MKLILDASAAVHVATQGEHAARFMFALERADQVLSPQLVQAEVGNALWKMHRFLGLPLADVQTDFDTALELIDAFLSDASLMPQALRLASQHQHPVYDMLYAAAALQSGAQLLTLDKKLSAICDKMAPGLVFAAQEPSP